MPPILSVRESGAKGSWFDTTEAGLSWQSDWNRNDFHGQLKDGYTDYFTTPDASGDYGSGVADARVDATRDLAFDAEGRFNVTPQSLSSFGLTSSQGTNPYVAVATYGGTVGVANKLGDLTLALHGSYDREAYPDVALFGAGSTALSADNYNDYGVKLRSELPPQRSGVAVGRVRLRRPALRRRDRCARLPT